MTLKKIILGTKDFLKILYEKFKLYKNFLKGQPYDIYVVKIVTSADAFHTIVKETNEKKSVAIVIQFTFQGKEIGNIVTYNHILIKQLDTLIKK